MSELLVPVIDGSIGKVALHSIKAENNSCGLTIYDDNGELIKSNILPEKTKETFNDIPSIEVRFHDFCSLDSCIQITENTQSITLGFLCEIYRVLNNRHLKEKWDYIVITGDVNKRSLESVSEIEKKFEGAIELSKKENKKVLFIYVNDKTVLKEGIYDENIQILQFSSKDKFEDLFYYLFEISLNDEQNSILRKISINNSNEFVETETYLKLRDEIIKPDSKYQGHFIIGKTNSGKSVIAYNLCLELMQRHNVYAPIWITLNNNKLQEILNPKNTNNNDTLKLKDNNNRNEKDRIELLTEYLFGLISINISSDKKYILVIDNLELSYADEILIGISKIKEKYPNNIFHSIVTSWNSPSQNEKIKELKFKQIQLTEVTSPEFLTILNAVIASQFTTKLQRLTPDEKNKLTEALYKELKDCPGDLPVTLSSIKNISVQNLIEILNEVSTDTNSKKYYFYTLSFEQLGLFSQIVLFQFIDKFGCEVCKLSDIKDLEKEIIEKKIIDQSLISDEAIEKALKQLANNYIIQSNLNNEYSIKNDILRFFLFSYKQNQTTCSLSQRFIDENKKIHMAILYNWNTEFEYIVENNSSIYEFCLTELAQYSNSTRLFDILFKHSDIDINISDVRGWTPLHFATRYNNNLKIFKYLIEKGADYHARTVHDFTILHLSVLNQNIEILKYILDEHLYDDIDFNNIDGISPLMLAGVYAPKYEFLRLLINKKASYKKSDNDGNTVLHYASVNNQLEIINYVIKKKLYKDINEVNHDKQNALAIAVSNNNNINIIQTLKDNGCVTDSSDINGHTLLHRATINENPNVIKYLLENHLYTDIDIKAGDIEATPLHVACENCSNPQMISTLIEHGASIEKVTREGSSIYHLVAKNSNECVFDYIFEQYPINKTDIKDYNGKTIVHYAIEFNDNVKIIKKLRKKKFNFSEIANLGQTVLHLAASNQNSTILDYVLKHHIYTDINEVDNDGFTALHYAAYNNSNTKIINLLLRCGANYKLRTNMGESVLMLAAQNNTDEIVKFILQRKLYEDINEADKDGLTAYLHGCMNSEYTEVLRLLHKAGVDYRKKSALGETGLIFAAGNANKAIIEFIYDNHLFDDINEVRTDGLTAYHYALLYNPNIDIIKYLLDKGVQKKSKSFLNRTSLHFVMGNPNLEIIKYFINKKLYSDINEVDNHKNNAFAFQIINNKTLEVFNLLEKAGCDSSVHTVQGENLLHIAIENECTEIIKYLLNKKICDINESTFDGNFPLSIAIEKAKNLDYVKLLISHGADFTKKINKEKSLLMLACEVGCTDIVEYILQNKMYNDINEKDNEGYTALHYAAMENENIQIIELLLKYKCDFTKVTNKGNTLIHFASINNFSNVLNYILSKHLFEDINKKDNTGQTVLHCAVQEGKNTENIRQLINAGANLSEVDNLNSTVLHKAAANVDETMVRLLVEELYFEEIDLKNDDGLTALHVAAQENNIEAFKYLTRLGLNPHEKNNDGKSAIDLVPLESKSKIDEFIKTIHY